MLYINIIYKYYIYTHLLTILYVYIYISFHDILYIIYVYIISYIPFWERHQVVSCHAPPGDGAASSYALETAR